jgi:hypothetical protein
MRKKHLLAIGVAGVLGAAFAPVSAAKDIVTVPICDTDGHCDKSCTVTTDRPPAVVQCR